MVAKGFCMLYAIELSEKLSRIVTVKAESKEEAIEKVSGEYVNGSITLEWGDFVGDEEYEFLEDYEFGNEDPDIE